MLTMHIWVRSHRSQLVLGGESRVEEVEGEEDKPEKKWDGEELMEEGQQSRVYGRGTITHFLPMIFCLTISNLVGC